MSDFRSIMPEHPPVTDWSTISTIPIRPGRKTFSDLGKIARAYAGSYTPSASSAATCDTYQAVRKSPTIPTTFLRRVIVRDVRPNSRRERRRSLRSARAQACQAIAVPPFTPDTMRSSSRGCAPSATSDRRVHCRLVNASRGALHQAMFRSRAIAHMPEFPKKDGDLFIKWDSHGILESGIKVDNALMER